MSELNIPISTAVSFVSLVLPSEKNKQKKLKNKIKDKKTGTKMWTNITTFFRLLVAAERGHGVLSSGAAHEADGSDV